MTSLFVSHGGRDRTATERVRDWLRAEGYAALFVDLDPDEGIGAGRDWERELYAQLRRSDGVVFLASAASTTSRWCFAEVSLARALGRPVFPVRVEPGARMDLLADVQWVDLAEGDLALSRLSAGLHRAGLDPADAFSWDPTRSPYPGLRPFEAADAAVFFGRGPEVSRLLELLQPTLRRGPGRLVAIIGPSGSGKSSLLRAGLLPRAARLGPRWVVLPPLRPGSDPTARLAGVLADAFAAQGDERPRADLAHSLDRGPEGLVDLARRLGESGSDPGAERRDVLVVIDQAEELLTLCGPREQQTFLGLLGGALRREDSPLWVVATVRSEFLTTAPDRAGLAEVIDDSLVVEPLSRSRLSEVIAGPARRAGLEFQPGLVERMVEDTAGGDALPLLAYTLSELYDRVGPEGRISSTDYEAVGGVVGALDKRADQVLDELTRRGLGPTVLPTLLKLAAVERRGEPTRRRVERRSLTPDERVVVEAFVEARLLVSTRGASDGDDGRDDDAALVDVAHEALLRQWPPLRAAIDEAHEWLERRSELDRLAADWEQGGRDESFLLRGSRLAVFDRWAGERAQDVSPLERRFLESSRALAARELTAARRSNRRLRALAGGLAAFLTLALVAAGLAWQQNREAQAQARLALSRQLAREADRLVDTRPHTAILAGLHGLGLSPDEDQQPPGGLVTGLARVTHASRTFSGHTDQAHSATVSPDGRLIASGGSDGAVLRWDAVTGDELEPRIDHGDEVWSVAISPDGGLLVSGGSDGRVRTWDPRSGRETGAALATGGSVWGTAFSPDGRLLASADDDGEVQLWDVASRQPHGDPLTGMDGAAYGVAISSGGLVAAAGQDGAAHVWDPGTGELLRQLRDQDEEEVLTVAVSPDGATLASGGLSGRTVLWDLDSGERLGEYGPSEDQHVRGLAFSPDGQLLAISSSESTITFLSVATRQPLGQSSVGGGDDIEGVAFAPDGETLVAATWGGPVQEIEVAETPSVSRVYRGRPDEFHGVDVSTDGRWLATAGADGTAQVWDLTSPLPISSTPTRGAQVTAVAFSPDGDVLASVDDAGGLVLSDPATGAPLGGPLVLGEGFLDSVAFSPDGRTLAIGVGDGTVQLVDVASRERRGPPLTGHLEEVNGVTFSPDGAFIASASTDSFIRLHDVATGEQVGEPLTGHQSPVYGVAFSPDGRVLASGGADGDVLLHDATTGEQVGEPLTGHTGDVNGVAFSPDGRSVASASADGSVRVWDVDAQQPRTVPLTGHHAAVTGVAFTPDGRFVASASQDGTVRLWDPGFSTWLETGCSLLNRNMTMAEWDTLLADFPYERTCPDLPSGHGAPPGAPVASG
jgi:WD40 repeat protein/energy-coupling factor transporter ATP-binding protein EcfA2